MTKETSAKRLRREGRKIVPKHRNVGIGSYEARIAALEGAARDIVAVLTEHREALDLLLAEPVDDSGA